MNLFTTVKQARNIALVAVLALTTFAAKASEYYWVGNGGSWSDFSNHWATTSGGSAFYLVIPSSVDNVHFDANSFTIPAQTVTLVSAVTINSMDWTGVVNNPPTLNCAGNSLTISGSFQLSPGMNVTNPGGITLTSTTTGNTFNGAGQTLSGVSFNGAGGAWTLQNVSWTGGIDIVQGTVNFPAGINFTGQNLTCNGSLTRGINFGTNDTLNLSGTFQVSGTGVTVTGGSTSVMYMTGSNSNFIGGGYTFNQMYFTNTGNGTATINNGTFGNVIYNGSGTLQWGLSPTQTNAKTITSTNSSSNTQLYGASTVDTMTCAGSLASYTLVDTVYSITCGQISLTSAQGSLFGNITAVSNQGHNLNGGGIFTGRVVLTTTGTTPVQTTLYTYGGYSVTHYNNLTINVPPGSTIQIRDNTTQYINGTLSISSGTCVAPVILNSYTSGSQGTISMTSGTFAVDYASVKDIAVTGGATFNATHVLDLGDNSGWNTFSTLTARNLYWVPGFTSGTGNWNDGSHWSLTSGGAGCGCPPTSLDHAYFDANSFIATGQTVTVTGAIAMVSMDWTGVTNNPTFANGGNTWTLSGSLTLVPGMNLTGQPSIYMTSTNTGNTLNGANHQLSGVSFNGAGGAWTLANVSWTNDIDVVQGTVNFPAGINYTGATITCNGSLTRAISFGAKDTLNLSGTFQVSGTGATITGGSTSVMYMTGNSSNFIGGGNTFNQVYFTDTGSGTTTIYNGTFSNVIYNGTGTLQWGLNPTQTNAKTITATNSSSSTQLYGPSTVDTMTCAGSLASYTLVDTVYSITCGQISLTSAQGSLFGNITATSTGGHNLNGGGIFTGTVTLTTVGTSPVQTTLYTYGGYSVTHYNNLTINVPAGSTVQIRDNTTQYINGTLSISGGNCIAPVILNSYTSGSQGTISMASGTFSIDYASIKDIAVTGGATFNATHVLDLGDNTGWNTFSTLTARNLYWIPGFTTGSGNWNDGSHWSLTSGGTASGCPPTSLDHVYFDANSFTATGQTVTVTGAIAMVSMNWTGVTNNPTLANGGNTWTLSGSLTLVTGMNLTGPPSINMTSTTTGNTFNGAGQQLSGISFNGAGGAWTLQNVSWTGGMDIVQGTVNFPAGINFTGLNLTCNGSLTRGINFGTNDTLNLSGTFQVTGTGVTVTGGSTSVMYMTGSNSNFIGGGYTFNQMYFTNTGNGTATINNGTFGNVIYDGSGTLQWGLSPTQTNAKTITSTNSSSTTQLYGASTVDTMTCAGSLASYTLVDTVYSITCGQISLTSAQGSLFGNITATSNQGHNLNGGGIFTGTVTLTSTGNSPVQTTLYTYGGYSATHYNNLNINMPPGSTLQIRDNTTQYINGTLNISSGNGSAPIYINSYLSGTQGTISVTSGSVCVDYVRIQDNNVTGGATFTAGPSSQDISNVTGWNFVSNSIIPTVTISDSALSTCPGSTNTFTAAVLNGGGTQTYNWTVNGVSKQNSSSVTFVTDSLVNGDDVRCVLSVSSGACAFTNAISSNPVTMTVSSLPTVTATPGDTSVCTGTSLTLNAGGATSYSWMPGSLTGTSVNVTPGATTTYTITGTSASGCIGQGTVTVNVAPLAITTGQIDTILCPGSSIQFNASGATSYEWTPTAGLNNPGIANPVATPSVSTTYTLTATKGSCGASTTVGVGVFPALQVPTITQSGDSLKCPNSLQYSSYQWYYSDVTISGATTSSITFQQNGKYSVVVNDANGCSASDSINVIFTGVLTNQTGNHSISLYPNPAGNQLTIDDSHFTTGNCSDCMMQVGIYNVLGERMISFSFGEGETQTINIKNLDAGIYFLYVQAPEGRWIGKFVKD